MPFERKPIVADPTCAMCGKPIKNHSKEELKSCMEQRRKGQTQRKNLDSS
ncbi:MAG: hypothetical protein HYZ56_01570 [Nitrosopumilales archaeon]|nr:hypothetical protein [Nitrosopumilales archaeon]